MGCEICSVFLWKETSLTKAVMVDLQDGQELEQITQADVQSQQTVRDMRQKVEEAKSSLSSNRSRGKVLDALMQQKRSGKIPGILGRLVRTSSHLVCSPHVILPLPSLAH